MNESMRSGRAVTKKDFARGWMRNLGRMLVLDPVEHELGPDVLVMTSRPPRVAPLLPHLTRTIGRQVHRPVTNDWARRLAGRLPRSGR